ncbi:MAG: hypothetical protein D6712_05940 [Chloroflexi bacterium]|nr:MAG: hypothetical protein D6712_05940 [Chloroflexota bacterium]
MRNYIMLDTCVVDEATGVLQFGEDRRNSRLSLRREGGYVAISASHGPIEIALRPRYEDLVRKLRLLQPVGELTTTRQVGTSDAFLALGLHSDGTLLLRATIVADATGHLSFNFALSDESRQRLFDWLEVPPPNPFDL